jgi:superfamily II DNA/RNA helicase
VSEVIAGEGRLFAEELDERWTAALAKRRIGAPTEIQGLVIPRILRGENVVFRSATGTGKTFAYLLPLLQLVANEEKTAMWPRALIVSPSLELCAQIKSEFDFLTGRAAFPRAALVIGGVKRERQQSQLKREKPCLLIGNTARLLSLAAERRLRFSAVRYLVFDEVDRLIAEDQREETGRLAAALGADCMVIASSATVRQKNIPALAALTGKAEGAFSFLETAAHEILRERIRHWAIWSEGRDKSAAIRSLLAALDAKRVLIFAENAEQARVIAARLQYRRYKALALYSGQPPAERKQAFESFKRGNITALVATDVAARGLDIPEVQYVVTAGVLESSEAYIHRAGRTARGGRDGVCISIGDEWELRRLQSIEKKLKITVYPKVLSSGRLVEPLPIDPLEPQV